MKTQTLSNKELLITIFGKRSINEVEKLFNNLLDNKSLDTFLRIDEPLMQYGEISSRYMEKFACLKELIKRINTQASHSIEKITSSRNVFDYYRNKIGYLHHEEFHVLYLNRANEIIKSIKISEGSNVGTVVDIVKILRYAIQLYAKSMIIVHNHPSGNTNPSGADENITKKVKESAKLMDISVLDHVIITNANYYSFAENSNVSFI